MGLSSRWIVAAGLGVVGAGLLSAPIQGQQDGAVRKTNGGASQFKEGIPPVIGTLDVENVFKSYDKVKFANEQFQGELLAKRNELMKLQQEMVQETEVLSRFTPGQEDYKKQENKLTELKAQIEAKREQAERQFQTREADLMASLYNEVAEVAKKIAKARKMTYVVKVMNQVPSGSNPNSVMAAMSNPMIYFDPANDITQDVIYNLNAVYKASGGPTASATPPAGAAAPTGAGAPAASTPAAAGTPKANLR